MKFLRFFISASILLASLALGSCGQAGGRKEDDGGNRREGDRTPTTLATRFVKPPPVSQDYVGSEACRRCHSDIMKEYESHPMSISMSVTSRYRVEDYPTAVPVNGGQGSAWSASISNGQVKHTETTRGGNGQELGSREELIQYTCGSGSNGCSYFVFDGGRLYESPITWYSEDRKWDLSPGYRIPGHLRFERMAGEGCLACHAGRMNPLADERSTFEQDRPFHELAIGCERCHGPGKSHIEFHDSSKNLQSVADPIVNPDKLAPELREAVCYQCHLRGSPKIPRYGRTDFDFRPGMHMSDVWITFVETVKAGEGKVNVVSQVEQMKQSQCYVQSEKSLGCTSCHDPHRSPAAEQRVEFYREKCIACHQPSKGQTDCSLSLADRTKESPQDSCIECHMPRLDADDIAHLTQTDHRVQIPGDSHRMPPGQQDGILIWNDREVPEREIQRAQAIAQAASATLSGNRVLAQHALNSLSEIHSPAPDDLPLNEALARLHYLAGDSGRAFEIWFSLLERYPRDQFLLDHLARSLQESGRLQDAYSVYERLLEVSDRRPSVLMRHLEVCKSLGKTNEGLRVALRILELEPGVKSVHQWLATVYRQKQETDKADFHQKMADQLLDE